MQNNFKFTMITLGQKEHHDICVQNEMFESSPLLS